MNELQQALTNEVAAASKIIKCYLEVLGDLEKDVGHANEKAVLYITRARKHLTEAGGDFELALYQLKEQPAEPAPERADFSLKAWLDSLRSSTSSLSSKSSIPAGAA